MFSEMLSMPIRKEKKKEWNKRQQFRSAEKLIHTKREF